MTTAKPTTAQKVYNAINNLSDLVIVTAEDLKGLATDLAACACDTANSGRNGAIVYKFWDGSKLMIGPTGYVVV